MAWVPVAPPIARNQFNVVTVEDFIALVPPGSPREVVEGAGQLWQIAQILFLFAD